MRLFWVSQVRLYPVNVPESQISRTDIPHLLLEGVSLQWSSVSGLTSTGSICSFWPGSQTQGQKHWDKPTSQIPVPGLWRSCSSHRHSSGWWPGCTGPAYRCGKHWGNPFVFLFVQRTQTDAAAAAAGWIEEEECSWFPRSGTGGQLEGWSRCRVYTAAFECTLLSDGAHL